jgi:pyrophosphatase PpaX
VSRETAGYYEGIHQLLGRIPESVKLGALTNACVAYAHAVLKVNHDDNIQVYKRFESINGADTAPQPKPNPDGILLCCQELDLDPSDCVYIGDSPSDIIAADAAG